MLQPFKNITIVMKEATNAGVTAVGNDGNHRVKDDQVHTPVTIDADGLGKAISADTDVSFGVLMNSFNKAGVAHQVMVHGIAPMVAHESITAGTQVAWDFTNKGLIPYVSGKCLVGKALTGASAKGDYVDVLIG